MKTIVLLCTLLCASIVAKAQTENLNKGITITVTVNNVSNDKGVLLFGLHSAKTFMKAKGLQNKISEIKDGKTTVTFTNVVEGTYAIMALHDENSNNRMDFETNGMPKESYGMSNNPMSYGPPQFEDAQFNVVDKNITLEIRL